MGTWIYNLVLRGEVRAEHKNWEIISIRKVFKAMGLNKVDWKTCGERKDGRPTQSPGVLRPSAFRQRRGGAHEGD